MSKVLIFFADGTEECEALLVVDLLRRAGMDIKTVSINADNSVLTSHKVRMFTDINIKDAMKEEADMVVVPGGIPGVPNLLANKSVCELCTKYAKEKAVAAICAGPSILGQLGILRGKRATVYPGFDDKLEGATYTAESVTVDGNILTANGLGAAIPFALEIIKYFEGEETAKATAGKIQYKF